MLYKRIKRKTNLRSPFEPSTFTRYRQDQNLESKKPLKKKNEKGK